MIKITNKQSGMDSYYDFSLVKGDTGQFIAKPKVNGNEYVMQTGDSIEFKVSKQPNGTAVITIVADSDKRISITAEDSEKLAVGDYYCDITLNYANGNKDTFIKIPTSNKVAIANFHVTYGV